MDTCGEGADRPQYVPILYRDGLLIALLIACPMRIKNLANLIIGQHLVLDGCAYGLKAQGRGDQDRQALRACVPNELTGYIDEWLWFHRPALQLMAAAGASVGSAAGRLWIDRWGQPMSIKAIQRQIWLRTRQAFGKGICPHLFRDIAGDRAGRCRARRDRHRRRPARPRRSAHYPALLHPSDGNKGSCSRPRGDRCPAPRGGITMSLTSTLGCG